MMSTEDLKADEALFCLFKGDPKCGKSVAAASFPGHKEDPTVGPFFFDTDKRIKSIANYYRGEKKFHYSQPNTFYDINNQLEEWLNYCPYHTIVLDGITTTGKLILNTMKTTRDPGAKKVVRGGIELNQIEDYGGESVGLDTIINNLKVISIRNKTNVIVTAHVLQTESTDIKTKITTVSRSLLTGGKKVAAALPVHFDEAYHFDVQTDLDPDKPPRFTVVTHHAGTDWAGTTLNLPMRIDITGKSLYDEIMKWVNNVQPVNDLSL